MAERDPKALLGQVVAGRYRLDAIVAMGGMGAVYRGEHVHMRKQVAVKLLHPETEKLPELVQRFERESIVGAHASHPNVASATDFGKAADGTYYLVLEYIEGITLRQLLTRGPLELERAVDIVRQIARGLEAIHKLGIVHRDLAPRNVMVSEAPPDAVKLIDFGFAKVPLEKFAHEAQQAVALTSKGMVFGTVGFMAPEAGFGMHAVTARSDLYALGVIFYEMLAGKHPFDHTDHKKLFQAHSLEEPPPPSARAPDRRIPRELEQIILRLIEKSPDERYPSAGAVVAALDEATATMSREEVAADEVEPARQRSDEASSPAELTAEEAATEAISREAFAEKRSRQKRDRERTSEPPAARRRPPKKRGALGLWLLLVPLVGAAAALFWVPDLLPRLRATLSGAENPGPAVSPPSVAPSPPDTATAPTVVASAPSPTVASSAPPAPQPRPEEIDGLDASGWSMVLREAANSQDAGRSAKALEAIARIEPERLGEPQVVSDAAAAAVIVALAGGELAESTFDLLGSESLGSAGPDILYRMMTIYGGSKGASLATKLLADEAVLGRASAALRIALELRSTPCAERVELFERAAAEGDGRALLILVGMQSDDCSACCMRHEPRLQPTIQAIRARL